MSQVSVNNLTLLLGVTDLVPGNMGKTGFSDLRIKIMSLYKIIHPNKA